MDERCDAYAEAYGSVRSHGARAPRRPSSRYRIRSVPLTVVRRATSPSVSAASSIPHVLDVESRLWLNRRFDSARSSEQPSEIWGCRRPLGGNSVCATVGSWSRPRRCASEARLWLRRCSTPSAISTMRSSPSRRSLGKSRRRRPDRGHGVLRARRKRQLRRLRTVGGHADHCRPRRQPLRHQRRRSGAPAVEPWGHCGRGPLAFALRSIAVALSSAWRRESRHERKARF
jgi:hypothetical protein